MRIITRAIVVAGVFLTFQIQSQTNVPLVQSGSKWINASYEYDLIDAYTRSKEHVVTNSAFCILQEDSIIKGKKFKRLDNCTGDYIGSLRDEGGKVFFVSKGSSREKLIYDFTLMPGDTAKNILIKPNSGFGYVLHSDVVESVDSVELYGVMRKRINFKNASWVEGIGNTQGFLVGHFKGDLKKDFLLQCMSANNVTLFPEAHGGECELPVDLKVGYRAVTELIYPTSSKGVFVMEMNRQINKGQILILGKEGKVVPKIEIKSGKIEIDMTDFKKGKYLILVRRESQLSLGQMLKL